VRPSAGTGRSQLIRGVRPTKPRIGCLTYYVIVLTALFAAAQSLGCIAMPCEDEVVAESASPKGPHSVRVLVRNCGATAPYVTVVQARTSGVFSQWTDIAHVVGRPVIDLRWSSVKTAVVAYGMCAPGKLEFLAGGIRGLDVQLLNDHALESRCSANGYWEPQLSGTHR